MMTVMMINLIIGEEEVIIEEEGVREEEKLEEGSEVIEGKNTEEEDLITQTNTHTIRKEEEDRFMLNLSLKHL